MERLVLQWVHLFVFHEDCSIFFLSCFAVHFSTERMCVVSVRVCLFHVRWEKSIQKNRVITRVLWVCVCCATTTRTCYKCLCLCGLGFFASECVCRCEARTFCHAFPQQCFHQVDEREGDAISTLWTFPLNEMIRGESCCCCYWKERGFWEVLIAWTTNAMCDLRIIWIHWYPFCQ